MQDSAALRVQYKYLSSTLLVPDQSHMPNICLSEFVLCTLRQQDGETFSFFKQMSRQLSSCQTKWSHWKSNEKIELNCYSSRYWGCRQQLHAMARLPRWGGGPTDPEEQLEPSLSSPLSHPEHTEVPYADPHYLCGCDTRINLPHLGLESVLKQNLMEEV